MRSANGNNPRPKASIQSVCVLRGSRIPCRAKIFSCRARGVWSANFATATWASRPGVAISWSIICAGIGAVCTSPAPARHAYFLRRYCSTVIFAGSISSFSADLLSDLVPRIPTARARLLIFGKIQPHHLARQIIGERPPYRFGTLVRGNLRGGYRRWRAHIGKIACTEQPELRQALGRHAELAPG